MTVNKFTYRRFPIMVGIAVTSVVICGARYMHYMHTAVVMFVS